MIHCLQNIIMFIALHILVDINKTSILSFCFQSNIDRNIIHNKNCKNGMKESTILSFTHIRKDKKYWHIGQIPFNYSWLKMKLVLYVIYSWLPNNISIQKQRDQNCKDLLSSFQYRPWIMIWDFIYCRTYHH